MQTEQDLASAAASSHRSNDHISSSSATRSGTKEGRGQYDEHSESSPGNEDFLSHAVDLDHGAGAAGYIGKLGKASWIERVHNLLSISGRSLHGTHMGKLDMTTPAQFSYSMDDVDLLGVDEDDINALFWPDVLTTLVLTEAYFHAMQGPFGFVIRDVFLQEVADFSHRQTRLHWDQPTWLGLANLVWAIASRW
jgi:hypothetical protein